jgi:hypothetical protein
MIVRVVAPFQTLAILTGGSASAVIYSCYTQ